MGEFNIYKNFEQEICLFLDHFLSVSPLKTAKKVQKFSRASRAGEFNFYKISQNLLWEVSSGTPDPDRRTSNRLRRNEGLEKKDVDTRIEGKGKNSPPQAEKNGWNRRKRKNEPIFPSKSRTSNRLRRNEGKYRMKESFCEIEVRRSGSGVPDDTSL